jgi:hypothetical protein
VAFPAAQTSRPGLAAHRARRGRWCRSTPSWPGCRCGYCPCPRPPGHVSHSPGARSSPIESGLEHRLGQLLEKPIRFSQRQPCSCANRTSSAAACCSGRFLSRLLLRHAIRCRHHGTFHAEDPSACQAGNTVRSTVPFTIKTVGMGPVFMKAVRVRALLVSWMRPTQLPQCRQPCP